MPSEFMPAREKKNLLYLCGVRHKFIRETDSVDFVYFEETTMSISHARCCYFDCRSRLRRSVAFAVAIDIINAYTRQREKCIIKTKIVILWIRSLAHQRRSPFRTPCMI